MPVLSDFTVIQGDSARRIGDGATLWETKFDTAPLFPGSKDTGVLMLTVRGLTATETDVEVKINNKKVGVIEHYNGADPRHWFTQIICTGKGVLLPEDNELQIQAVSFPGAGGDNLFDDIHVKDVVFFFKQHSTGPGGIF